MKLTEGRKIIGAAGNGTELLAEYGPGDKPEWAATLGTWFLDCPGQSPAWRHYVLSVIHLRSVEGAKPAQIRRDGATHELMMAALDPRRNPTATDVCSMAPLQPMNLEEQVVVADDAAAMALLDHAAQAVVDGLLWAEPPLSHQVEPWRAWLRAHEHGWAAPHRIN